MTEACAEGEPLLVKINYLSRAAYSAKTDLALFCPVTRQVKDSAFEVLLPDGLSVPGVAWADQCSRDFDARFIAFADTAPQTLVTDVLQKLTLLL